MGRLDDFISKVHRGANKHAPALLTGLGIGGFVLTVVSASKATLKAVEVLRELEEETDGKADVWQKAKAVVPGYIPSVIAGGLSIACFVKSNRISANRIAAYAGAYSLAEQTLDTYQKKVAEKLGEKKEKEIRDEIAKDRMESKPVSSTEVIVTGDGDSLCYDIISGRYFKTNIEKIRRAVNRLNYRMLSEMYISLNELYSELGMRPIASGDNLGWNIGNGLIEISFSSQIADDGTPCLVLDYLVEPREDFTNLH